MTPKRARSNNESVEACQARGVGCSGGLSLSILPILSALMVILACSARSSPVTGGASGGPDGSAGRGGTGGSAAPPPGFLRVQGTGIVDGDGRPVFLEGVSLGNEVWANVAVPTDHGEVDFARLMGRADQPRGRALKAAVMAPRCLPTLARARKSEASWYASPRV